jgi:hypothetical protein
MRNEKLRNLEKCMFKCQMFNFNFFVFVPVALLYYCTRYCTY